MNCISLLYTTQHRTVLIIFPFILQTIIIAQMMSSEGGRNHSIHCHNNYVFQPSSNLRKFSIWNDKTLVIKTGMYCTFHINIHLLFCHINTLQTHWPLYHRPAQFITKQCITVVTSRISNKWPAITKLCTWYTAISKITRTAWHPESKQHSGQSH